MESKIVLEETGIRTQESPLKTQSSESIDQFVRDTSVVREELYKIRSLLAAQSCNLLQKASVDVNKEREIVKMIKDLQGEMVDLSSQIDSALVQMRDKEVENLFLKQNLEQAKARWERKSLPICECSIV